MEVITIKKSPSWSGTLTAMKVEEKILTDLNKRGTVAPLISRQLSLSHPNMKWVTRKVESGGKSYLEIERVA